MKKLIGLSLILLFTSCSMLKKGKAHDQMSKEIENYAYPMPLAELFKKVYKRLNSSSFTDGKFIMTTAAPNAANNAKNQEKVREKLENGFIYNKKLFVPKNDIGMSLLTLDFKDAKERIFAAEYHVIKNTKKEFIIVDKDTVITGKRISKDKSSLKISTITKAVTPLKLSIDWMSILKGKGLKFDVTEQPIDLNRSLKHSVRNKTEELSYYFHLNKEDANKREAQLLETL